MKTSIATSALLGVIASANQMRPDGQLYAQVMSVSSANASSAVSGLATCETYEDDEDVELTVRECLEVLAFNDKNLEQPISRA